MSNLNDIKIETLTSEHVQLCHALHELADSENISRSALSLLVEKLCDQSELLDLKIHTQPK